MLVKQQITERSMTPQTIQIFLPDGSPTSIREAQITNRLVQAVLFPRKKMKEAAKREMVHFTGVYFLFGRDEQTFEERVYIGEGEECFARIKDHNRKRDFWTHCVIVATKTDDYTKTDGKYLEHYCLQEATRIGRYKIVNDKDSQRPSISESREFDLLDNYETIKILLATLGFPIFEERRKAKTNKDLFYCVSKDADATGELTDDGFVVYKGSKANGSESALVRSWVLNLRTVLKEKGVLKADKETLVFEDDQIFSSPSAAAAAVLGRTANGWTVWKNKEGKTLDALIRK